MEETRVMAERDDRAARRRERRLPEMIDLLLRSKRRVLRELERRLRCRADAEDVLQAALLKVVAKSKTLRDEQRLLPWFARILRNELADHRRRQAALARLTARLSADAERAAGRDAALSQVTCRCLADVLTSLPRAQGDLIRSIELEGESPGAAAARLGITAGAASVRLHRARRALRSALLAFCRICARHARLDCGCGGVPLPGAARGRTAPLTGAATSRGAARRRRSGRRRDESQARAEAA
jgi:RNA polymerase sigma factor (sigma-70 family)